MRLSAEQAEDVMEGLNRRSIMDCTLQRDLHGIFLYESEASVEISSDGGKRVRFANLLENVVAEVEKVAESTDGRWTRGLHKRTSDAVAAKHVPVSACAPGHCDKEGRGLKTILKPFVLLHSADGVQEALVKIKAGTQNSVMRGEICTSLSKQALSLGVQISCIVSHQRSTSILRIACEQGLQHLRDQHSEQCQILHEYAVRLEIVHV